MFNPKIHTLEYFETEWNITKKTLLFQRIQKIGLNQEQLASVLWAILGTCPHCHNADINCQCWNNE